MYYFLKTFFEKILFFYFCFVNNHKNSQNLPKVLEILDFWRSEMAHSPRHLKRCQLGYLMLEIFQKFVEVTDPHPNLGPPWVGFLVGFLTKLEQKPQNHDISRSRGSWVRVWWFLDAQLPLRGVLNRFRVHLSTSSPPNPVILFKNSKSLLYWPNPKQILDK